MGHTAPQAISLDIETLSLSSNAVVLSIGACVVTPDGPLTGSRSTFYRTLKIQDQLDKGRVIDGNTLAWWMNQPKDVQEATFSQENEAYMTMIELRTWIIAAGDCDVFVKGPHFDAAIIQSLANDSHVGQPTSYRQYRDLRTIETMARWAGPDAMLCLELARVENDSPHNALADAISQGDDIAWAMKYFKEE